VLPAGGGEQILAADLVIDATGRSGRTPAWLTELGYDPPAEQQLPVDLISVAVTASKTGYVTAKVTLRENGKAA
jgi:hypothetical protein